MPTITSTDNKGLLKLDSQFVYRPVCMSVPLSVTWSWWSWWCLSSRQQHSE